MGIYQEKNIIQKDAQTPMFIALCTIAKTTEATYVSTDKGMDKKDVVHKCNGILLSHKKEWNSHLQ